MTQDVNVPDNDQPDILAEMLAAARASRGTVDGSPYSSGRQDEIDERQYANEWQMAAADAAHDEIQALRVVARTRANDSAYSAWMTAQWFEARRKQHAAEARAVDLERQLAEALKDSAYEHEALMAAQARIAELSTAVRFAEPAPIERAGPDLATAHAITAHDPTFWFRRCTLLERERAELCAQNARLEARLKAAGGDKPAAAAPAEPPATLGDKPRKVWTEDVKRAILTALVEVPRNLSEMRADGWMAEVPDRQFAACILEMSRTWQLMRPVPGAPEGTYELTPAGADSARAMLADADDDAPVATLGDRRQQEARSIEWTPPTRSKPDAAA